MHSSCKRDQTGAAPVVGSISSPVAQPVERPTLNREVDGANPSGAAISSLRSTRRITRRWINWEIAAPTLRRQAGQNRPGAPFQQRSRSSMYRAPRFERGGCRRNSCREHHSFSRRSPMKRQRAQTSSSAGASPAAGTTLAPVAQRRGSGLKPRSVSVRIRPGALLLSARVAQ